MGQGLNDGGGINGHGHSDQKAKRRMLLVVAYVLEAHVLVVRVSGGFASGGCEKLGGQVSGSRAVVVVECN